MTALRARGFDWRLFIAQGFGSGRAPFAPGTFGTAVGVLWFLALLLTGNKYVFCAAILASIGVSVWTATHAERVLGKSDPGSVVIDEIVAVPACFLGWLFRHSVLPTAGEAMRHPGMLVAVFCLFRFFDIVKPWPVGRSQKLPRGWGITVDDLLAATYVNLVWFIPNFGQ